MEKRWEIAESNAKLRREIGAALGVSDTIADVLVNRGFRDVASAAEFFFVERQAFGDPFLLRDMERAVERISRAIDAQERITVYGDYDVDGITATSLLLKVLWDLGAAADFYIPERQSEGYGLHAAALEKLWEGGASLLITVDCGIGAVAEVAQCRDRLDLILTDHHLPSETLPEAFAVLNPKRPDCAYPDKELAGAGVAFKLCQALWQRRRGAALERYLEIAALGTIADIVPLTGENRLLVKRGLAALNATDNIGLRALIAVCALQDKQINAGHVGFILAPRLNAAGRLGSAAAAVELLTTTDAARAAAIARQLDEENQRRQEIEAEILAAAEEKLAAEDKQAARVLVVAGEDWNSGVIGIVASRLVEKYYRPTVVISLCDGMGKGSCRSIRGFHLHAALTRCADLLESFGGHAQAAGLTLRPERIPELRQRLSAIAEATLAAADFTPVLPIDAALAADALTENFVEELACLEPYGMGNPRPLFACLKTRLTEARAMGKESVHLRFKVAQGGRQLAGVAWHMGGAAGELLAQEELDVAFQPEINEWNGRRSVQLKAQDFRPHERVLTRIDELFLAAEDADRYRDIGAAEQFFTKAVGVTFDGRQERIARLKAGDDLRLSRQPENPHDQHAIALLAPDGMDIGFLRAEIAARLAPLMDGGEAVYAARVISITGAAATSFGVNLLVWRVREARPEIARPASLTPEEARRALLGERPYHDKQRDALRALEGGANTLAIMGTSRGKSAIFQARALLLAVNERKLTIVLYPLRALVNDQYVSLRERLEPLGICVRRGNGTLSPDERGALFEAACGRTVDILLTTPEFLTANLEALRLTEREIGLFVVDECHHIADGGRRPAYQKLEFLLRRLGSPPTLGVTATADAAVAARIQKALGIQTTVVDRTERSNLALREGRNTADKLAYLRSLLGRGEKTLIFVNSRKKAVEIAAALREAFPALAERIGFYHAGLSNEWRAKVETWFKEGTLQVVAATSAFGEGVDLPDIRHVVQFHLPFDLTAFNQQCGRAGRDGAASFVHLLFGEDDVRLNRLILKERAPERETVAGVYLLLKQQGAGETHVERTNAELAALFDRRYHAYISEAGIGVCLRILEEIGLALRETFGGARRICLNPAPPQKLDLFQSPSYAEGEREREAFEEFAGRVLHWPGEKLLSCINKPIYPAE